MRRLIQIGVAVVSLTLLTRTWLVQGLVDRLVVAGGSMAPALLGAHRQVTCRDCGFKFACGEESLPADMQATCPNCSAKNDLEPLTPLPGERLIVDRAAYASHGPERWDVVMLHAPDDPAALCVKRVVGLPGETVEVRDGDVYIDRQPARRSLRQLLAMAIPVYDASFRPASGGHDRWQAAQTGSGWKPAPSGYEHSPREADSEVDWLLYQHLQTHLGDQPGPVLDDLAYNQNESRQLLPVSDLLLRCRIESRGSGQLWLRADDGRKKFEIELDVQSGSGQVRSGGERLAQFSSGHRPLDRPAEVVLALANAQLRLTLGGKLLIEVAYDPAGLEYQPVPRPLAIGSAGASLAVTGLCVLRDVYYLAPPDRGAAAPHELDANQYWLLGDNSAWSVDSRRWSAVQGNLFVGKVLIHR